MQRNENVQMDNFVRILIVAGLLYLSFQLIQPFIGFLLWAFILATALYPLYDWLKVKLHGHAYLAAFLTTLLALIVVVGTVFVLADNLISTINLIIRKVKDHEQLFPELPEQIINLPVIGEQIQSIWMAASSNITEVISQYSNYIITAGGMAFGKAIHKSLELFLFVMSVLFAGYLFVCSEAIAQYTQRFALRISPERGKSYVALVKDTIQNVSRGVIGIALMQFILFGILLLIAGVPGAGLISFIGLILCIAQIGLLILVVPVIIWMFYTKTIIFAVIMSVLMSAVGLLDNVLKPIILARGLPTPMAVILFGVIGGVMIHGVVGVFVGPVILALIFDLVNYWLE